MPETSNESGPAAPASRPPVPQPPIPQAVITVVQSSSWLRWLPLVLALVLGVWLGYLVGAYRLGVVRAELVAIKDAEARAKREYDDTTQRLQAKAAVLEAEHKASIEKIETGFVRDRNQLQQGLDRSEERVAQAQRKVADASRELVSVRRQIPKTGGADQAALKLRELELVTIQQRLEQSALGLQCLRVPVPAEELGILNRQGSL